MKVNPTFCKRRYYHCSSQFIEPLALIYSFEKYPSLLYCIASGHYSYASYFPSAAISDRYISIPAASFS